jgi:hypothetical protein
MYGDGAFYLHSAVHKLYKKISFHLRIYLGSSSIDFYPDL